MFQPVGKPVETSGITPRHVACVEPTIREVRPCRHLILPISGQDIVALTQISPTVPSATSHPSGPTKRIALSHPANGTNSQGQCQLSGKWRMARFQSRHRSATRICRSCTALISVTGTSVEPMENSRMLERSVLAQFSCLTMAPRIVALNSSA